MLSNPLYIKECERVVNYMLSLSLVCKYDFKTQDLNSIRTENGKKLNDEIIQFFKRNGGVETVYNMFRDSYMINKKHISIVWNYVNKYKVQPYKLRTKTDFEVVNIPVFFEYLGE
ncbi:hypothetical protein [Aliarcobacter butzleri]|uniref:hypothetical protein n=1 Tax=Aliarcobacter butzleri TaxID=28197 RepID=UPI001ED9EF60|nr:hypothetical protein [Aliarcobacter butzleri]MCG3685926.1 hypothetical protein [Aliarcobacter butzleri]